MSFFGNIPVLLSFDGLGQLVSSTYTLSMLVTNNESVPMRVDEDNDGAYDQLYNSTSNSWSKTNYSKAGDSTVLTFKVLFYKAGKVKTITSNNRRLRGAMPDLRALRALEQLDFQDITVGQENRFSSFTNFDLRYFSKLLRIYLPTTSSFGQLLTIDTSLNTLLQYLVIPGHKLSALDISANTALIDIRTGNGTVGQNPTGNLTITGLAGKTALTSVLLDHSKLTSLDFTGCTALLTINCITNSITSVDVTNCNSLITLTAYGNAITTLTALSSRTTLVTIQLGDGASTGQTGAGLGVLSLGSLTALVTCDLNNCGVSGTLTLPSSSMTRLVVHGNSGLTSITTIPNTVTLMTVYGTALASAPNIPTGVTDIRFGDSASTGITGSGITSLDFSVISATNTNRLWINNCSALASITLPGSSKNIGSFIAANNASLATLTNLSTTNFPDLVGSINGVFNVSGCGLNMAFPLGTVIKSRSISLQNNAISNANVNTTIDDLYTNRAAFNNASIAKSLNISGTNAAPSGTLVAPTGYVQATTGVPGNDGTPANQKEKIYVLINQNNDNLTTKKYNWSITTN